MEEYDLTHDWSGRLTKLNVQAVVFRVKLATGIIDRESKFHYCQSLCLRFYTVTLRQWLGCFSVGPSVRMLLTRCYWLFVCHFGFSFAELELFSCYHWPWSDSQYFLRWFSKLDVVKAKFRFCLDQSDHRKQSVWLVWFGPIRSQIVFNKATTFAVCAGLLNKTTRVKVEIWYCTSKW